MRPKSSFDVVKKWSYDCFLIILGIKFFILDNDTRTGVDEYADCDTSDEEDIRNTVGNIPMNWYNEYKHLGKSY